MIALPDKSLTSWLPPTKSEYFRLRSYHVVHWPVFMATPAKSVGHKIVGPKGQRGNWNSWENLHGLQNGSRTSQCDHFVQHIIQGSIGMCLYYSSIDEVYSTPAEPTTYEQKQQISSGIYSPCLKQ